MWDYDDNERKLIFTPQGELDHCMARNMRAEIDAMILKTGANTLMIDMSGISFMDSSGIGMMIGRYKLMKKRGGRVCVKGMRANVLRIFRMSGLAQIILCEDSQSTGEAKQAAGNERKENK